MSGREQRDAKSIQEETMNTESAVNNASEKGHSASEQKQANEQAPVTKNEVEQLAKTLAEEKSQSDNPASNSGEKKDKSKQTRLESGKDKKDSASSPKGEAENDSQTPDDAETQAHIKFERVEYGKLSSDRASVQAFLTSLEEKLKDSEKSREVKKEFPEFDPGALDFAKGSILAKDSEDTKMEEESTVATVKWAINEIAKVSK